MTRRPTDMRGKCPRCYADLTQIYERNRHGELRPKGLGCARCARRDAGLCVDCGKRPPTSKRAWRCARCQRAAERSKWLRFDEAHRAERNAAERERLKNNPEYRQKRLAHARFWRARNPVAIRRLNRKSRKKYKRYWARWRKAHREELRVSMRERYRREHPGWDKLPVCVVCGREIEWSGPTRRPKRCDECATPQMLRNRSKPFPPINPVKGSPESPESGATT